MVMSWPLLYKKTNSISKTREKTVDTKKLIQDETTRKNYQCRVAEQIKEAQTQERRLPHQRWEQIKGIIHQSALEEIGTVSKTTSNRINDLTLETMSKEQKELRMKLEICKNAEKILEMRRQRKTILKKMQKRMKEVRDKQIEDILNEVAGVKDDNRMFKAIKALYSKKSTIKFVHDENGRSVVEPQEMQRLIEKHFKGQLNKPDAVEVPKFITEARKLNRMITAEEVSQNATRMANNRKSGKDLVAVEWIKHGPEELKEEIADILNGIFEHNDHQMKMGQGILLPIPKPNKPQGPIKNLRPITLLEVIRKILSKIFISRAEEKINQFLPQSQSAYRKKRGTTDIVWAYRWIVAKTQKEDVTVFSTGIDMSSAFDTINRKQTLDIAKEFLNEDELRILTILLSDTDLEIQLKGAESTPFASNIGSPQGDAISGPIFTVYLARAIQEFDKAMEVEPFDIRACNRELLEKLESSLPDKLMYADDCDFLTEIEEEKEKHVRIAKEVLARHNLIINEGKTEQVTIKRGKVQEEKWRNVIKLGSKLGDKEDIKRRKELATIAMKNNENLWKSKWKASMKKRLELYDLLVKSILLYNCGTWGMTKTEAKKLDSFHRKQLRRIVGIKWPQIISNESLYKKTGAEQASKTVMRRRWKLLGHILRLPAESPARQAMKFYFEERKSRHKIKGTRTTIVTTINDDIYRTITKNPSCGLCPLQTHVSLQNMRTKAKNRKLWSVIVNQVVDSAYSS